jgi:hypothetical protein
MNTVHLYLKFLRRSEPHELPEANAERSDAGIFPAGGPGGETECQYRQYSALNKDFQMDDVFIDPKLLVINKIIFWVVVIVSCG